MNCSKCNSAIPDSSKFCPVCGTKVEQAAAGKFCTNCGNALADGMLFCAECGTAVNAAAPAPVSAVPTPVNDVPAVSAVPMPANDIGAAAAAPATASAPVGGVDLNNGGAAAAVNEAPVASAVPTPVNDVPAVSAVPMPANDIGAAATAPAAASAPVGGVDLNNGGAAAAVNEVPVASAVPTPVNDVPAVNAVPMPTNDIGAPAAAPVMTSAPTGGVDLNKVGVTSPAADLGMSAASSSVAAPVKKKKIGLWIGVGAAAVVAIAGAVVGFCFRGVAANLVMGNNKYARMVEGDAVKTVSKTLDTASENPEMKEAMSVAMGSAITTLNTMRETNPDMDYSEMTSASFNIGWDQMVDMDYSAMMKAYGMNSATVTFDTDIELTDAGKEALGISGDDIDEVLDMINDCKLELSATASEDSMDAYIGLTDGTGFKLDAKGIVCSDGNIGVMLPFAGNKCLAFKVENTGSADTNVAAETVEFELDPKELNRLYGELAEIYLTYYENGQTTVTGGSEITAAGITQKGRLISVTLNGDKIRMMVGDIMKHIAADEYVLSKINEFAEAIGEDFDAEEFKAQTDTSVEEIEDAPFSITVETLVDFNGNVLAKSYAVTNSDGIEIADNADEDGTADMMQSSADEVKTIKMTMLAKDMQSAVSVFADSKELMFAKLTAKNETDGTLRVEVISDSMTVGINLDYEGVKTVKYLENDITVGKYSVYMAGTEASEASGSMFRMNYENAVDGNTYTTSMNAEISSYGSIGFNVSVTPESKDAPSIPADAFVMEISADGTLVDEADNKAGAEYMLEMLKDAKAVCDENASSPLVEIAAPLVQSGIEYFEQILTPMASEEAVYQMYSDAEDLSDDILEFYNEHYMIIDVDDALFDTINQLYINVGGLSDEIDSFTEMEQTLFDEYQVTLDTYGKQFNEFVEKIEQLEEERANSSAGDISGIYDLAVVVIAGQEIDATELYTSYYLQLSDDGQYLMECEGEIAEGIWATQEDRVILSNSNGSMFLTYRNGDIVYGEDGMEMVFRKR